MNKCESRYNMECVFVDNQIPLPKSRSKQKDERSRRRSMEQEG